MYKPQNVYVMRDIMSSGYRAGGNTKFFGDSGRAERTNRLVAAAAPADKDATRLANQNHTEPGEISNSMMRRLNFEEGDGSIDEQPESLLAFPMSAAQYQSGAMNTEMSVTSRLLPWEVNTRKHDSFPGGDAMHAIYENAFQLKSVHFGEDLRATENMEYMSQVRALFLAKHNIQVPFYDTYTHVASNPSPSYAGLYQQLALLHRPAPQVGLPHRLVRPARPGHGALGPGRSPWRRECQCFHAYMLDMLACILPPLILHTYTLKQARWRRGEAVSMISAREAMLSYEQLQYIPKTIA